MTQKNILIISSQPEKPIFFSLFEELANKGYSLHLMVGSPDFFKENKRAYSVKKMIMFPAEIGGFFAGLRFFILAPVYFFIFWFQLAGYKRKNKIRTIICFGWPEKIIATPVAKLLNLKIFWLEPPEDVFARENKGTLCLFRLMSGWARLLVFSNFTKAQLIKTGTDQRIISFIRPGLMLSRFQQDNIFNQLAETEHKKTDRKFFTVGTVLNIDQKKKLEVLFQAAKKCLAVIPNLQLVIIGDGAERKDSAWLAKRMQIDGLVWFVGGQKHLKKWFDNFDIFACTDQTPKLADINTVFEAAIAGLPIIGPSDSGWDDIIQESVGLLFARDNSEELAQTIIRLYKDKRWRLNLGASARETVKKDFSLENMVKQLEEIM